MFVLCAALACTGCVIEHIDESGNPVNNEERFKGLPVQDGLLMASIGEIQDPLTFEIFPKNPKIVHMVGLIGPDADDHPALYEQAMKFHHQWLAQCNRTVWIRPLIGSNLELRDIYGTVMVWNEAYKGFHEIAGEMISRGLCRIGDASKFENEALGRRLQTLQEEARAKKVGMWAPGAIKKN